MTPFAHAPGLPVVQPASVGTHAGFASCPPPPASSWVPLSPPYVDVDPSGRAPPPPSSAAPPSSSESSGTSVPLAQAASAPPTTSAAIPATSFIAIREIVALLCDGPRPLQRDACETRI